MAKPRPRRTARPSINPQRLLDAVPAAIVYMDRRRRILAASHAYEHQIGVPRARIVGRTPAEAFGADVYATVQPWLDRAFAGESVTFERVSVLPEGGTRDLKVEYIPDLGPRGAIRGVFGIVTDISVQKAAQHEAEDREAQLRGIFELGLIGVAVNGPDGKRIWFNDRLCEIYGRSRMDIESTRGTDFIHPDDLAGVLAQRARLASGESDGYLTETRYLRKDGEMVYARLVVRAVRSPGGALDHTVNLVHDMTDIRRAEIEARAVAEHHRLAAEAARVYPWYWREGDAAPTWLHDPEALLGTRPGSGQYPLFSQMVHTEDREAFRSIRRRAVNNRGGHTSEFRILRTDGEVRWVIGRGESQVDGNGTRLTGVMVDIHERKLADQARAQLEQRNSALADAIENASLEMCLCDAEDRIVIANRTFREANDERAAFLAPGMPYESYLRAGLRLGIPLDARNREDAWLAARLAQRKSGGAMFEAHMLDGKWLLVNDHRLPDGSTLTTGLDITTRKHAEQALADTERRFRDFATASAEWFWETDQDGLYTWFSEEVERVIGFPAEWHYGKSRAGLAEAAGTDLTLDPWRSHLETMARHEPFRDFRFVRRAPDGLRWISSSAVPHFGPDGAFLGYRGTGIDITRQVMLEQRARAADEKLRLAIEDLNEPICLTDADDKIIMANRAFHRINANVEAHLEPGLPYETHLRAGLSAGNYSEAIGREEDWLRKRLAQRRAGGGPIEQRRSDGLVLVGYDQRFPDGSVLTYVMDITDRRRAEDELRALTESLEERVAERTAALEVAMRELEAFSYSVSHDLRAPLRAINGYSRILAEEEREQISAEGQNHLKSIERNALRMGELVDDLLDLARVNRAELRRRRIDLGDLARSVADELSPSWPRAEVEIGAMPMVEGDPGLARQILVNLISNALKYSARREGGARVQVDWDAAHAACRVRDNGVGFNMAHAGKLFGTFERLHTTKEFEGTGIGLAIVKRIVERHGGRVWAEATPGEGATFRFTLS